MRYKITTVLLLLAFLAMETKAQDRHFTLYNFSPLTLNPAYTGSFLGTVRVGGIFRDQSPTFMASPNIQDFTTSRTGEYFTYSGYADSPILAVRKRDWVGAGLMVYRDKAGTFGLGQNLFMISGSYHLSLNRKQTSVLSVGVQFGSIGRSVDYSPDLAVWGTGGMEIIAPNNALGGGAGQAGGGNQNQSSNDWNAGVLLKTQPNKETKLELGMAFSHITIPGSRGLFNTRNNNTYTLLDSLSARFTDFSRLPMLFSAHGQVDVMMTKKWFITPSFLVQKIRGAKFETVVQVPVGLVLNEEEKQKISLGLGYRFGDALEFLVGYEQDRLRVGASFDLALISTRNTAINSFGAFELAAAYIINIYKEPDVKPVIICPRL